MSIDLRQLPTLDHLKGFAAAARHLSFTRAAAELFLTQSAISRQIQTLEAQLGVTLFVRATRRLSLTPAGEQLQRTVDSIFRQLAETTETLRHSRRPVSISAAIGIASLWLVPRLSSFMADHPEVDVRISANNRVIDLEREGIDLAVRYCAPNEAPPGALLLFSEEIFPVGSPAVIGELTERPLTAADLARLTLLHFEDNSRYPWLQWSAWLAKLGLAGAKPQAELHFNHYDQMIHAAVAGHGLALARSVLVQDFLDSGRLVALAGPRLALTERATWLVPAPGAERPEVIVLRDWLVATARKTPSAPL